MSTTRVIVPNRIHWALEVLDPRPADEVLEIGSGPGVAAALVCEVLETGRLLAIDRSAVATRRTSKRNTAHVEAGRLEVRTVALAALEVPAHSLDIAFSVNVNLFWTRSPRPRTGDTCPRAAPRWVGARVLRLWRTTDRPAGDHRRRQRAAPARVRRCADAQRR